MAKRADHKTKATTMAMGMAMAVPAVPMTAFDHHRDEHGDDGDAFIPDVARTHERLTDDEAEAFAEEFIAGATSGEFVGEDARDEWVADEVGGPFLLIDLNRHDVLERIAAYDDEEMPAE